MTLHAKLKFSKLIFNNAHIFPCSRCAQVTFVKISHLKLISFKNDKHWYLYNSYLALKGTVVIQALSSFHWGSLVFARTDPLINIFINKNPKIQIMPGKEIPKLKILHMDTIISKRSISSSRKPSFWRHSAYHEALEVILRGSWRPYTPSLGGGQYNFRIFYCNIFGLLRN